MAEGARLESVFTSNSNKSSNLFLSAITIKTDAVRKDCGGFFVSGRGTEYQENEPDEVGEFDNSAGQPNWSRRPKVERA